MPTHEPLCLLLRQATASLDQLKRRAENVLALEDPVAIGFCPKQLKTLCGIIDQGRGRIQRHLVKMDGPEAQGADEESNLGPSRNGADPLSFMAEYKASCRLLCRALNEALRNTHGSVCAVLSDFVLRLEKQLWLMDAPITEPVSDRYRWVSLFLTC